MPAENPWSGGSDSPSEDPNQDNGSARLQPFSHAEIAPLTPTLRLLQAGFLIAAATCVTIIAAAFTRMPGSDGPALLVVAGSIALAVIALAVIRYARRRPIATPDRGRYARIAGARILIALLPLTAGIATALVSGDPIPALAGGLASIPALAASFPSVRDYRHHREEATVTGPPLPSSLWGSADPAEPTPWDAEHGEHH